ncbi:hypothetical protein ACTGVD_11275, partial [Streptococcus suis]
DVTESRVSQMRAQALVMVRDGINSQLDPDKVSDAERPGGCVDRRRASYLAAVARAGDVRRTLPAAREGEAPARPAGRLTRTA